MGGGCSTCACHNSDDSVRELKPMEGGVGLSDKIPQLYEYFNLHGNQSYDKLVLRDDPLSDFESLGRAFMGRVDSEAVVVDWR